ncbi:Uncharacterised protein [Yersinia enterocolitica]|nr:Uncharacterised protein [Yersinia enterocolitica]
MQVVAGDFGFLDVEHVLCHIFKAALRQGFHHFQTGAIFVDNFLSELDVFNDVAFRHIFRAVGISRRNHFFVGNWR